MDQAVKPPVSRSDLLTRWGMLKSERASWWSHWQDISANLLPRAGRFFVQDRNRGQKRHQAIYDNTATRSLRILGAGLMGGMTSPARPWFRLTTPHADLNKQTAVREWLSDVTTLMLEVFSKSNTYRALHQGYEELGSFGTFATIVTEDYKSVIHHHPLTTGEFCVAANWRGDVDTLYREFQKPVGAIVKEFGRENCSATVQNMFDRGTLDAWVTLVHCIEPRDDRDPRMKDARNMAWRSVYLELGGDREQRLREGGFKSFPALAARWATQGGDIYGTSPAMDALGDVRQLQHQQLRKGQVIDYQTKPPLQVPTSLKNRDVDALPGGVTFYDNNSPQAGIRSMFDVNLRLDYLLTDIQDVRQRINSAFYTDLFMMISEADGKMTAYEVARRNEEKMMMLGPVLERLHNELLDPLVESTFAQMVAAGIVPPPPPEMQGVDLNVEFVSMLAQAQRAIATNGIDRYVANLGQIAAFKPDVLDKFDSDHWADEYADMLGVDPRMVVSNDKVALIRNHRAQQQQAMQQTAQAEQAASAMQKLGGVQTGMGAGNAANDVMRAFSGYTGAA